MEKFSLNFDDLQTKLKQKKAFKLADVKHRLKKVAFDVVRFVDADRIDDLWQIHRESENGDEYIVAMYDNLEKTASVSPATPWRVLPDRQGNLQVLFSNTPITHLSLASLGIPVEDAEVVCSSLSSKLAHDQAFLQLFTDSLTVPERDTLVELANKTQESK